MRKSKKGKVRIISRLYNMEGGKEMKKKRLKKVAEVKVSEVAKGKVKAEEQPQRRVHPLAAWDDLMFMGRRPQTSKATETTKDTLEEK